jgi:hypothetical protein
MKHSDAERILKSNPQTALEVLDPVPRSVHSGI